jgi:hypothetical protein
MWRIFLGGDGAEVVGNKTLGGTSRLSLGIQSILMVRDQSLRAKKKIPNPGNNPRANCR